MVKRSGADARRGVSQRRHRAVVGIGTACAYPRSPSVMKGSKMMIGVAVGVDGSRSRVGVGVDVRVPVGVLTASPSASAWGCAPSRTGGWVWDPCCRQHQSLTWKM
jgi:hypothetical protein